MVWPSASIFSIKNPGTGNTEATLGKGVQGGAKMGARGAKKDATSYFQTPPKVDSRTLKRFRWANTVKKIRQVG